MECYSCLDLSGKRRICPGQTIYKGKYWNIEHAYPSGVLGWLVIVLKRHCESLHELSKEEFVELHVIQKKIIVELHKYLNTKKEYVVCFSEGEHFNHIHFHIIPKTEEFLDENKGVNVFKLLKINLIDGRKIINFCNEFAKRL